MDSNLFTIIATRFHSSALKLHINLAKKLQLTSGHIGIEVTGPGATGEISLIWNFHWLAKYKHENLNVTLAQKAQNIEFDFHSIGRYFFLFFGRYFSQA